MVMCRLSTVSDIGWVSARKIHGYKVELSDCTIFGAREHRRHHFRAFPAPTPCDASTSTRTVSCAFSLCQECSPRAHTVCQIFLHKNSRQMTRCILRRYGPALLLMHCQDLEGAHCIAPDRSRTSGLYNCPPCLGRLERCRSRGRARALVGCRLTSTRSAAERSSRTFLSRVPRRGVLTYSPSYSGPSCCGKTKGALPCPP
jgi:hypothetical protein